MSADKVREIIDRAMADRSVYDAMAARENEVWGKVLPERDQSDLAIEDTKAALDPWASPQLFIALSTSQKRKD